DARGRRKFVFLLCGLLCGDSSRGWRHIRDGLHFGGKWSRTVDMFLNMALTDSHSETLDRYNDRTRHTYRAYRLGIANSLTHQDLGIIRAVVDIDSDVIVSAFFEDDRSDLIQW
ncbi:MAG TPA: hypothetical protein VII47_06375, partial [Actinomycetota bacterium]